MIDTIDVINLECYTGYVAPRADVIQVKPEGVICTSGRRVNYGEANEDEWN